MQRDILAHRGFQPIVGEVVTMDPRIFRHEPMKLKQALLAIDLVDRMHFDSRPDVAFYNFQGLQVRSAKDVADIGSTAEGAYPPMGRRVSVVDEHADRVRDLQARCCTTVSSCIASAFMRLELGAALEHRGLTPHIFDTPTEALAAAGPSPSV